MKWCVGALALCSALLAALEVLRGRGSWSGSGDGDGAEHGTEHGTAPHRLELTSASRDTRLALAVALLDRRGDLVCSGVSVSARWALSAAHCLRAAPTHAQAAHAARGVRLAALYAHGRFSFRARAAWAVLGVRALAADVALAEARGPLHARAPPPALAPRRASPLAPRRPAYTLSHYTLRDLVGKDLVMVGFRQRAWGEDAAAELRVASYTGAVCGARGPWVTPGAAREDGTAPWRGTVCARAVRPLCAGESGGGLFLGNQLVAIASLGPLNCSRPSLSVFTIISPFIKSINMTIARRSLRYQAEEQMYVDLSYQTTTVPPYIEAIRSKYTSSHYTFEDKIIEKFDKVPDSAYKQIGSSSGGATRAPVVDIVGQ